MPWLVNCFCGTTIHGTDDDEIVKNAQDHAKNKHALTVTREQVMALAERES
jgi:predicted small metal-binding protein